MFRQNIEMVSSTGYMRARNNILLYLFSFFNHFTPLYTEKALHCTTKTLSCQHKDGARTPKPPSQICLSSRADGGLQQLELARDLLISCSAKIADNYICGAGGEISLVAYPG